MPITNYVSVGDQQWAQPDDFINFSWWSIAAACPAGACSGTLAGLDMDGWTFASVDAVNGLFNTYIAAAGATAGGYPLDGPGTASEQDSTWASQFLADFTPTDTFLLTQQVIGLTATSVNADPFSARVASITDAGIGRDSAASGFGFFKSVSSIAIGAWFIRDDPSVVPTPATLGLFGIGLAGLCWTRCRHSSSC